MYFTCHCHHHRYTKKPHNLYEHCPYKINSKSLNINTGLIRIKQRRQISCLDSDVYFTLSVDQEAKPLQIHPIPSKYQGNLPTRHQFIKWRHYWQQQNRPLLQNILPHTEHAGKVLYHHGYRSSCGRGLLTWRPSNSRLLFFQWLEFLRWCVFQWILPWARSLQLYWYASLSVLFVSL